MVAPNDGLTDAFPGFWNFPISGISEFPGFPNFPDFRDFRGFQRVVTVSKKIKLREIDRKTIDNSIT